MSMEQILERVAREIEFTFAGGGFPSNWRQSGYRDAIFDCFLEAQKIQTLRGDQMVARVRDHHMKNASSEELEVLRDVGDAWNEWMYVTDRMSKPTR